ncbi:tRNA 2-thiouridine(34) synthase MnmA [Candidatus Uhrbacteria bacterium]|nr:tRNA 2-thiouridine(34) synthase MnmA [Candidatus Uhrbacteria bacterium]
MTEKTAKSGKTVFVGLSGGVDSAVAAALLQEQGYTVVGAFMKNWSDTKDPVTGGCAWRREKHDAERVAVRLGIPFVVFDFEKEYREAVVGYMVREYAAGRTPNPDVLCNRDIKFDLFMGEARRLGADMIATGHYCRTERSQTGEYRLLAGLDRNKDQSYFLNQITQRQLSRVLFPIGHFRKPKVRELARKFGLPVAEKKDSQGICFIGKVKLGDFLGQRIESRSGTVIDVRGREVGKHSGLVHYTVGQRHGLGMAGGPWFVVDKDLKNNRLIVAQARDEKKALYSKSLAFGPVHWIAGHPPILPLKCRARIRYRQPLQAVTVTRKGERGSWVAEFVRKQRAMTPGQFIVFYDGENCLGGGVIRNRL